MKTEHQNRLKGGESEEAQSTATRRVSIREEWMATRGVDFINENIFRWAWPHKGLQRGVRYVRRSRKPAENADQRKKGHL